MLAGIDKVLFYNNLGELVLAQKGSRVDVSHLPKGLYFSEGSGWR